MRKLLALILSLIMVFALTACGSDAGEKTQTEATQTEEEKELLVPYYDEATDKYGYCTLDGEKKID
ncbi:MAG: hypothetical protein IJO09_03015, partial [Oscillospiraceae bacterium]|nr:hypothetical protein [Oscillospiraceae bacterium]